MEWYGYTGRILRVDLSRDYFGVEDLEPEDAKLFLGGTGLAAKILFEEMDPRVDPFSPENKVVIATGPLTGTVVVGGSRSVIASKSPLTLGWGEAHFGGFWGTELKRAGYDAMVIEGRASSPVYLYVSDDSAEVEDASHLWGKSTSETERAIREEKDDKVRVLSIGLAGENLVRYAVVVTDERVGGRTGMGAVLGSKNLKAVAVKGTKKIRIRDPGRTRSLVARLMPSIMSYPPNQIRSLYGTNGEMEVFHEYGDVPIKNFTLGEWEGIGRISGRRIVESFLRRHRACFNCPVHCWKDIHVDSGEHACTAGRAPEYETAASLGALLLNDRPDAIARMEYLCNEYGMDVISTGVTIAWLMEAHERGVIDRSPIGFDLSWGDYRAILRLIELIARREGIGDLLAEGVRMASKKVGRGSERFAMHVKGVEIPMHDPRAFKGMGLQYATSNRGADHLYGAFFRIEQGERIPDLGLHERVDRFAFKGKGWMVAVMQDWSEVVESLGLCKFVFMQPGIVAGFYSIVTGIRKTHRELLKDGERIFNLKRIFNLIAGVSFEQDRLPERLLKEPLDRGGARGQVVELDAMLKEYYDYRGWSGRGVPSREKLGELGLLEIVEKKVSECGASLPLE